MKGYNKSAVEKYLKIYENKERYYECKGTTKNSGGEAISLSDEIGSKKAARQLGINYATLIDWRKKRIQLELPLKKSKNKSGYTFLFITTR